LAAVVESDREFARILKKFYWERGEGLETSDLDDFKDWIAQRFAGESWPSLSGEPDYFETTFIPRLHAGAIDAVGMSSDLPNPIQTSVHHKMIGPLHDIGRLRSPR
jgi:hypothetical protein